MLEKLSRLSSRSFAGQVIRLPLRLIPPDLTVPVVSGSARGLKWKTGVGNNGTWLGTYERDLQAIFDNRIKPGFTVYDIGANVGFFTLLAARLTGPSGKVIAFEPNPANRQRIEELVTLNRFRNVGIRETAVSDSEGECGFDFSRGSYESRLDQNAPLQVRTESLDHLVYTKDLPLPDFIKIDVEGAELGVLNGARRLLREHRPELFIGFHGEAIRQSCFSLLETLGYHFDREASDQLCLAADRATVKTSV